MDKLKEKLEIIRRQKEQALGTYNACVGAEQILLELIKESEENAEKDNG